MGATPSGNGYWMVNSIGRVFAFGDAEHHGATDTVDSPLRIVAIEPSPTGNGYWLVSARGRVFAFGDAEFWGDARDRALDSPVVGFASMPEGWGYYLVTAGGRVLGFGSAQFRGGLGSIDEPHGPAVGIRTNANGRGYWIATTPR
jgi:hypothetical protein